MAAAAPKADEERRNSRAVDMMLTNTNCSREYRSLEVRYEVPGGYEMNILSMEESLIVLHFPSATQYTFYWPVDPDILGMPAEKSEFSRSSGVLLSDG